MRRSSFVVIGTCVGALMAFVPAAFGQALPDNTWSHGTTLNLFAGAATTSESTRGTLGGGFGWEINHWVEVEGTGKWLVARQGDEAFAAELAVMANLTRPNTVVPFLGAGVGVYHASFDSSHGTLPDFYQRRVAAGAVGSTVAFNDPSFVFSGGVNVMAGRHFSIRPEVSVRLAYAASDTYAVTMATVHLTYHFERHDIGR